MGTILRAIAAVTTQLQRLAIPGRPRPWVMAHRGSSDLAPENGPTAFELAVAHGADLIETDLWFTSDDEIVCHHDRSLQRMTGDPRAVTDVTLRELSRLRLRRQPEHASGPDECIPSLAQLVAQVPSHIPVILELKDVRFGEPRRLQRLLDILGPRVPEHRAGIITTDLRLLRAIKARAPQLVTGHICMSNPLGHGHTELLGPYWPLLRLNPLYVRAAHRRRQRVCPLDPGLHRRLGWYLNLNVDAVLTNDPGETRRRLDELRARLQAGPC